MTSRRSFEMYITANQIAVTSHGDYSISIKYRIGFTNKTLFQVTLHN